MQISLAQDFYRTIHYGQSHHQPSIKINFRTKDASLRDAENQSLEKQKLSFVKKPFVIILSLHKPPEFVLFCFWLIQFYPMKEFMPILLAYFICSLLCFQVTILFIVPAKFE